MKSSGLPCTSSGAASATASSSGSSQSRSSLAKSPSTWPSTRSFVPGMADAEPHPPVVRRAQHAVHAAQPVMPRRAAAALHPHLARHEVEFVVERGDRLGRQLVERGGLLHRCAELVHVGLRLQREDLLAGDVALG